MNEDFSHSDDDEVLPSAPSMILDVSDHVKKWELKKANLEKGLGAEGEVESIRYIIQTLCDHEILSRKEERTIADAMLLQRSEVSECLHNFRLLRMSLERRN